MELHATSVAWTGRGRLRIARRVTLLARRGNSGRKLRTTQWKKRAREKFWVEHREKLHLVLIGGAVVAAASCVALVALH